MTSSDVEEDLVEEAGEMAWLPAEELAGVWPSSGVSEGERQRRRFTCRP